MIKKSFYSRNHVLGGDYYFALKTMETMVKASIWPSRSVLQAEFMSYFLLHWKISRIMKLPDWRTSLSPHYGISSTSGWFSCPLSSKLFVHLSLLIPCKYSARRMVQASPNKFNIINKCQRPFFSSDKQTLN